MDGRQLGWAIPIPFRSEKQRRFLWAKHPKIAKKWTSKYGSKPVDGLKSAKPKSHG